MSVSENILWSIVDGEAVLIDTSSGNYFSLNPIATEIWQELQYGRSPAEITDSVAGKYGVTKETVDRDVKDLIEELTRAKIWKSNVPEGA